MVDKRFEPRKAWGGRVAHVMGRCKYCKEFSFAQTMMIDEEGRPYHQKCHENRMREIADSTQNLQES